MKRVISTFIAILAAILFIIADHTPWWAAIFCIAATIGCFAWVTTKTENNTWLWVLAMVAAFFAARYVALPVFGFIATIWGGILSVAASIIGWGFGALGIVGGVIVLVIVVAWLKNLFS